MSMTCWQRVSVWAVVVTVGTVTWTATPRAAFQAAPQAAAQPAEEVPTDLRPLLSPPLSEMRLVVQRYTLDRNTLNGNFLPGSGRQGGGGRGGRAGGAPQAAPAATQGFTVSLSPNRIARLKRFDLDWQSALAGVSAASLSASAQTDLAGLKTTIAANLAQLDADAAAIATVMPVVPFAAEVIALVEHRMRMGDMDAQASAGALDQMTKSVARVRASLQAGLPAGPMA